VTIPLPVREALGIEAGTEVDFELARLFARGRVAINAVVFAEFPCASASLSAIRHRTQT
jgi:hypothetical protein